MLSDKYSPKCTTGPNVNCALTCKGLLKTEWLGKDLLLTLHSITGHTGCQYIYSVLSEREGGVA